ncbi:hypothetical protein TNIN_255601 [Trichonephila inaurata madagascariensis]|uniref:Uncharacterized protein n=1 Tax=Trichonephila inaurata madagascariensis TaxID=2747483 RepID=A0A8X7BV08_9ARAC|nr:hypothetical protein TNIN_255601 [Trichonephila inaurata madagascariensis]
MFVTHVVRGVESVCVTTLSEHYARVFLVHWNLVAPREVYPYKIQITGIPLQGRVRLWSHCISNTKDCDSTLHLAFAPLEEPLQDSEPTGLPLRPSYPWSNCISIMLRTVTLPSPSLRSLHKIGRSVIVLVFIFPVQDVDSRS